MRTLVVSPVALYRFIRNKTHKIFSFIMNSKHRMRLIALTHHYRSRSYTYRICSYVLCTLERRIPLTIRIVDRKKPSCAEKLNIFVATRFRMRSVGGRNNEKSKTDRIEVLVLFPQCLERKAL